MFMEDGHLKKVTENCSKKVNTGIIVKEAKIMNDHPSIALIVWRLYVAILAPSSNCVSASVKDCSKNFNMKFEGTTEINGEDFEKVMVALESLPEKEREVTVLRFGLKDGAPKSLEEIGKLFGVTRERIRQLEAKALRRMRVPSRLCKLPALFGFVPPEEPKSKVDTEATDIDFDTDILDLGLSVRAYNCLKRFACINTVGDILNYPKEDWPKVKNLGRKATLEIQYKMREVGYPDFSIE